MKNTTQWVSPRPNGKWAVQGAGNKRATKLFNTQKEATVLAISIAKNKQGEVIIQKKNGIIRSKDSYGNDPCPPRDKEH